jgi:hypothetical protein
MILDFIVILTCLALLWFVFRSAVEVWRHL